MRSLKKFFVFAVFGFVSLTFLIPYPLYADGMDSPMGNGNQVIISIVVDPNALGPGLPGEDALTGIGQEILQKHFPQDLGLSQKVQGNIVLTDPKTFQYELMAVFLYKESYMAVDHHVVFTLSGNQYTVISAK